MGKSALIIGATGQDGSHLADFLLEKDYDVYGLTRRTAHYNLQNIEHLIGNDKLHILYGDVTDQPSLFNAVETSNPDEIYNLAAQSLVAESWNQPIYTCEVGGIGSLNCLEAIRMSKKNVKYFFAGSSEQFANQTEPIFNESSKFNPQNLYGCAKCFGSQATKIYRDKYNMYACTGIMSNHESPRRNIQFVTRKITNGVAQIYLNISKKIQLGNIDVQKDWGYAVDFVRAMWMMLQQDNPEDYILCTGKAHYLSEFLSESFLCIGIENWKDYIEINQNFVRKNEAKLIIGDYSKIKNNIGWEPIVGFKEMIRIMVENDIELLRKKQK